MRNKFAIAFPNQKPGPVSQFLDARLGPNEAFEIDCGDIKRRAEVRLEFFKGFAVIESKTQLDVVAVYTAMGATTKQVETLDIERVPARKISRGCPDLVVEKIHRPLWDSVNHRSVIGAPIRNVGDAIAAPTIARVVDPTTPQPTGAPYNAIANTPQLAPGPIAVVVFFYLPYWVYNPDVTLEITADYKNQLSECDETNNTKVFEDTG